MLNIVSGGKLKRLRKYQSCKLISEWNLNCEWKKKYLASFGIIRWADFESMVAFKHYTLLQSKAVVCKMMM